MISKKNIANIFLLLITMIWGLGFVFVELLFAENMTPGLILTVRGFLFTLGTVVLFNKKLLHMTRKDVKVGIIAGVLNTFAFLVQIYAQQFTVASHSALITVMYVLVVPFMLWAFYKIKPSFYTLIAVSVCVVGAVILAADGLTGTAEGKSVLFGDLLTVVSALLFGMSLAYIGNSAKDTPYENTSFFLGLTMLVICGLYYLIIEGHPVPNPQNPLKTVLILLYLGLFSSLFCQVGQVVCQKYTSAVSISIIFSLEGFFGGVFAVLFGEQITWNLVVGGLIIIFSIYLSEVIFPHIAKRKLLKQQSGSEPKQPSGGASD